MFRSVFVLGFIFFVLLSKAQKVEGLAASFSFNKGDASDDVSKNKAKVYGVTWSEDRFGNARSACYLQGNFDSYLNLGSGNELKPRNGSISLWIKIDQTVYKGTGADNNPIIITKSRSQNDFNEAYIITYHFNIRKLCCNTSLSETKQVQLFPSMTTYMREWYHVVMTYDDENLCFYVNGVMEGKASKGFESRFLEGDSVIVGQRVEKRNQRYFQGYIDDIQIYNRVLSNSDVLNLYNAPNPNRSALVFKWVLYFLTGILLLLLIIWIIKWRFTKILKEEKEKNQLKNNWYEQENKVLTAQMNPHFIFNSLNTIQQFIIINDNEKAQVYLTKFSRLLRMILESNMKDSISLNEEIEIIRHYLEIESLRFNNVFKYKIVTNVEMNLQTIQIPRFLIQPFVENAIWHGLLPKEGDKQLQISFEVIDEKTLSCVIEDNGIGRKKAIDIEKSEKNKSLAINFIEQRLQLMSKIYKAPYDIQIIDKIHASGESAGTKIIATIPILKN